MNKKTIKKKIRKIFIVFQRYILAPAQAIVVIATIFVIMKTNQITNTANLLQINDAIQNRIDIVAEIERQYKKYNNSGISDPAKKEELDDEMTAAASALLNAYEFACDQYLTNKIDRDAFKKIYKDLIKFMKTESDYNSYFEPVYGIEPPYPAIDQVYKEWHCGTTR